MLKLRGLQKALRLRRLRTQLDRARPTRSRTPRFDTIEEAVGALTPGFLRPVHLRPFSEKLELAPHGRLRLVVSVPPRFSKTELVMAAVATYLKREPSLPIMYVSYGARLAYSKSRRMRKLAMQAGVKLSADARAKGEWLTDEEGGLRAAGIGGDVTGHGAGVLFVDDPVKNRAEAESRIIRERTWEWFTSTATTRLEPDESIIIVQTRWHEDDLAGMAIRELGYEYLCLAAINDAGESLWPQRFSSADLKQRRKEVGEYDWASLYMGAPRPRGGRAFGDAVLIQRSEIPRSGRIVIGVDLAHTARTRSDYNAAVVMMESGGKFYVLNVVHEQSPVTSEQRDGKVVEEGFVRKLRALQEAYGGARFHMYISGREDQVLDLLGKIGEDERVHITPRQAHHDKWIRATKFATAWRDGDVMLPRDPENVRQSWTSTFVRELAEFTGKEGQRDDQVDAAAAAFDALRESDGLTVSTPSSPADGGVPAEPSRNQIAKPGRRGVFAG